MAKALRSVLAMLGAAVLLSACASLNATTDPGGDNDFSAENQHSLTPSQFVGMWILADTDGRECEIELHASETEVASRNPALIDSNCDEALSHVAVWALENGKIALFDAAGAEVGRFEAAAIYRYQGDVILTTGVSSSATFVRGA